jgi:WD40 repeat protein/serine/threonine protein kinase
MADPHPSEKSIFLEALERTSAAERAAYLDRACGDNSSLRAKVEALLQAHEKPQGLLDNAEAAVPTIDQPPLRERLGTVIGQYKLLQQIGEGGMGTVYMAEQTQPVQRRVALKIIKPNMDSGQVIARFEAERQALALMDHPNIAKVLDAGTTGGEPGGVSSGRPYFVMELVKGIPITKYCDERRLTPKERLHLFVPVCQAVQHAHQKGIIHRDLKPSNVLIALYDGRPVPKIIDFGVAKATGPKLTERTLFTEFGSVVGTLEYMSPEQAELNQLDIDTRSDIYSLGVLLYELLTGTTPLEKKRLKDAAILEVLRIIREEEPPRPSTRLSTTEELPTIAANRSLEPRKLSTLVKGELDWIVLKALDKDRNRRYETANGMAQDIERYLADEPVLACPPSTAYRLRKFVRRNKGPVVAASLIALALVGGIIGTTIGLFRAEEAREAEAQQRQAAHDNEQKALASAAAEQKASQTALAQEAEAQAHRLAWQSAATLPTNPGLALLLAIEGAQRGSPRLAIHNNALLAALADCREESTLVIKPQAGSQGISKLAATSVSFSQDGSQIVTMAEGIENRSFQKDNVTHQLSIRLGIAQVRTLDGRLVTTIQAPLHQSFAQVKLSPDGRLLAGRFANSARISYLTSKDWDKCEHWLYTDRVVRIWDVSTGKELHVLRGHKDHVIGISFSPDSRRLLTVSWDKSGRIWDVKTGQQLAVIGEGSAALEAGTFDPSGQRILTVSHGLNRSASYDPNPGDKNPPRTVDPPLAAKQPEAPICQVHFWGQGRGYTSASMTTTVKLPLLGELNPMGSRRLGVQLWETASGKEIIVAALTKSDPDDAADIICAAFSADCRRIVTGTRRGPVLVCSADDGKQLLRFRGREAAIRSLAVSHDDKRLLLVYEDGGLAVHDALSGKEVRSWPGSVAGVRAAHWSRDGQRIFVVHGQAQAPDPGNTGSALERSQAVSNPQTQTVSILDIATGYEVSQLKGHEDDVTAAALSPDGRHLVTASLDGTARIWHANEAPGYGTVFRSAGPVANASFSPDGRLLLVANAKAYQKDDWDSFATIWDVATGKRVSVLRGQDRPRSSQHVKKGLGGVRVAQFSPDGKRVLTVSDDRFVGVIKPDVSGNVLFSTPMEQWPLAEEIPLTPVRVWDAGTGRELFALQGFKSSVDWASFSPDGRRILTFSGRRHRTSYLFQVRDGKTTANSTHGSLVNDPNLPVVQVWDAGSGKRTHGIRDRLNPTNDWWSGVAWAPDSRSVAGANLMGLLDLEAGKRVLVPVWSSSTLSFSPDGRYLLARSSVETALFDLTTLEAPNGWQDEQIEVRTISPDGKEKVSTATRFDCRSIRKVQLLGHAGPLSSAAFSADSRWLVTTSEDRTARLWEVQSGKLCHVLQGHLRKVTAAAFSPDGRLVVTSSDDHTARIWDTASGKEVLTFTGHQGLIRAVAFSPDGQIVLTAADDGVARLWPIDPLRLAVQRKPRELTSEERQRYAIDLPEKP